MSQSTYLHYFSEAPVVLTGDLVRKVLSNLGVAATVRIFRLAGDSFLWDSFKTGHETWPETEINGLRVPADRAASYFDDPEKYLLVDCIEGASSDRRAQIVHSMHARFPAELQREFYLNNLEVNFGPHDIFESVESPEGELFARTNFSVAFWGYRHPAELESFRAFIKESPIVQDIRRDLSEVTSAPIGYRVYLT